MYFGGRAKARSVVCHAQVIVDGLWNSYNASGLPDPTRWSQSGSIYYTAAWQIEELTIDAGLSGHNFTLSVLASDCEPTAHYGYVYLDGFGSRIPDPTVPEPASLALRNYSIKGKN